MNDSEHPWRPTEGRERERERVCVCVCECETENLQSVCILADMLWQTLDADPAAPTCTVWPCCGSMSSSRSSIQAPRHPNGQTPPRNLSDS